MPDQDQLAQRQAQLNKALSTALLNHQISELESQVKHLPAPGTALQNESQQQQTPAAVGKEKPKPLARIDDNLSFGEDGARRLDDERERDEDIDVDEDTEPEWRVAVVDVSAFMWAPQAARNLVQKGFEVIVPANGIVTLDLLKKGDSPSAQAARKAARYIEHASRQYKVLSSDPSVTVQIGTNYKRGTGLRFQREEETRQIDEMSSLPLMPGEEGPPKWVQSVLGCAAYFVGINKAELDNTFDRDECEIPPALYIASPSFAIQIAQDPTDTRPLTRENREEAERNGSKNERGEGVILQEEAERFELGIAILRDNDDVQPQFNNRSDRDRGNWRSGPRGPGGQADRQRNGTGARSKKKEEVVPEVKVLLRRPQAQGEVPFSDQSDSPASLVMALPDVLIPPPLGLQPGTLGNSRSSLDISPPTNSRNLPADTKSPVSKFVPLTRETHPVRRYADSTSSHDEPSHRDRAGRGGGRGGRGGRGTAGAGRGSGRSKNKERDSEFKNGNFVLLKRPDPPAPAPPPVASGKLASTLPSRPSKSSTNANAGSGPAKQVTILARKPAPPPASATATAKQESPKPTPTPPPIQPPATSPARTILQRTPRAPATTQFTSPAATAPRSFAPETRGRGRGRGGGGGGGRGTAFQSQSQNRSRSSALAATPAPVPAPAPPPVAPAATPKAMNADAATFEFDEAMLRPGYGSSSVQPSLTNGTVSGANGFNSSGRGRGRGHAHAHGHGNGHANGHGVGGPGMSRGRGGFRPPHHHPHPHPHPHHHYHDHLHQQHPHHHDHHADFMGFDQAAHQPHTPVTPLGWRPAEPTKKIILQRPTS